MTAVLYCPACGVDRLWDEFTVEDLVLIDHWPGTGMALPCPRCGAAAAPRSALTEEVPDA